ncbi:MULTISPECIES: ABC transporter permease [Streptomyces]|uniref:ABC-type transport system involved in multi-copper enzyme maturation, permease component n=1 Tax=Streptomyces chartreusis NRRL 3882 TaxID=1079985 RepID=A0A2N9BBT0_STRCX|nr:MULTISPECIES: ABC transporter permease [Streptomyces]MYS90458.1 ABC transporter permease [Streptomyces sp. SID5464]SOR80818.1 ABC-type transport system involved in multi-copper enzyme maturation, permease component [Streptomyces chartreusis NRRL 3882]
MTTATLPYRVTPARVLRSEWHKLRTLRSTWITLIATSALTVAMGAGLAAAYDGSDEGGMDTVLFILLGTQFATINLGVLGVLATAGEYSTGQIRATMTAVPRRLPVLWSKAAVLAAIAFPLTLLTNLITFPLAQSFLSGTDQAASLGDPGVLRALVGNAAGLTLLAVLALGIGALVRSVPMAIGVFIGLIMIVPEVLAMLPYEIVDDAVRYFPGKALETLTTAQPLPGTASPGTALLAMILWTTATLTLAAAVLRRRDV